MVSEKDKEERLKKLEDYVYRNWAFNKGIKMGFLGVLILLAPMWLMAIVGGVGCCITLWRLLQEKFKPDTEEDKK